MTAVAAIAFIVGSFVVALILNSFGNLESRWAYREIFVAQNGISHGTLWSTISARVGFLIFYSSSSLFVKIFRSPWWLLSHEKEEKAIRSLRRFGQSEDEIMKTAANVKLTLEKIRRETEGVTYAECFRKSNLHRQIVSIFPLSIQALCGVFFVAAYSTYYVHLAGYSADESFKIAIAQQALMVDDIVSWFIIDRVGRRKISVWGFAAFTVLLFITGGLGVRTDSPGCVKGTSL
jgi:MFS family permease